MGHALLTSEELERLNLPNKRTELVRGRLVVREPAGWEHGVVSARVVAALSNHVSRDHGLVVGTETGFTLFRAPDTVRAPDAAFISRARIPVETPTGFAEIAPDLVVEVLSPDDRPGEVREKVADWLGAGVKVVWILDPRARTARVVMASGAELALAEGDAIDGAELLPGFSVALRKLFDG